MEINPWLLDGILLSHGTGHWRDMDRKFLANICDKQVNHWPSSVLTKDVKNLSMK